MYGCMVTLQAMDAVFYEAQRQGRFSFYMTATGEEAVRTRTRARNRLRSNAYTHTHTHLTRARALIRTRDSHTHAEQHWQRRRTARRGRCFRAVP